MERLRRQSRSRPARREVEDEVDVAPGRRTLSMTWRGPASNAPPPVVRVDRAWQGNVRGVDEELAAAHGLAPFEPRWSGPILRDARGPAPAAIDPASIEATLAEPSRPLPADARHQLERATGADLGDVRVHDGPAAAAAAKALNANAFVVGQHIVFGEGQFAPDRPEGFRLLAHEVAHTIQQRSLPAASADLRVSTPGDAGELEAERFADAATEARRSATHAATSAPVPLTAIASPTLQAEWRPGARLPEQAPGGEPIRDASGRPMQGRRGDPIQLYHFRGVNPNERVLVIGGMHGNERSGIEVVDIILDHLRAGRRPRCDVYVIPVLHRANAEQGRRNTPGDGSTRDPNREFPAEGTSFATHEQRRTDPATPEAQRPRRLQPESEALLHVIETVHPTRIVQVHGTTHPSAAGFSRDEQHVPGEPNLDPHHGARDTDPDAEVVRDMARAMRARDEARRERDPDGDGPRRHHRRHDSVRGNDDDRVEWGRGTPHGTSLGEWASAPRDDGSPAMSVITVEPNGNDGSVRRDGTDVDRRAELMDLAEVVEEFLLGMPPATGAAREPQDGDAGRPARGEP